MRMIRVLLADDEPVILRGLKKLLSWEELGLMIVGEANDGNELKQLIAECQPDLVISDISMPGCSGIDIIRDIHQSKLPIKVIFISAYQEFSYAKQALQYGALDYVVKPVIKSQLEQVLSRAVSQIRQESEGERNKEMLELYEKKDRIVTIEELLDRLTDGDKGTAVVLTNMGVLVVSSYVSICMLEIDEDTELSLRWEERERKLVEFALHNIIKETMDDIRSGFVFRKGERFGILLQHDCLSESAKLAEDLHSKINSYLKLNVSIGIGSAVDDISSADKSYREAVKALGRKYFIGVNRVITHETFRDEGEAQLSTLAELQAELVVTLTSQNEGRVSVMIQQILQSIRMFAGSSKNLAVSSVCNTIMMLEQELLDFGIKVNESNQELYSILESLIDYATFDKVGEEFEKIVDRMYQQLASRMGNKEVAQLSQVKKYIEENYASNITLESMAALVFMNSYYFSSFFKKHTGQNFKHYVTEVRMKHALQLLQQNDLMVYEIAERVGYNNARHFSDMFKKKYGKLPQEYKQSARKQ
ncbi:response regulator [Paenibacillus sp. FA6]|uniref:response regulator n=1 Tax=Paenibacillus sp. FA6 TaxID=3413029 RepID=UPI003F65C4B4